MDTLLKTPYESFGINFVFDNDLGSDETLSSVTVQAINALTGQDTTSIIIGAVEPFSTYACVFIQNGNVDETHMIKVTGITNLSHSFQTNILLKITDDINWSFTKQSTDHFVIAVDFSNQLRSGSNLSGGTFTVTDSSGNDVTASIIAGSVVEGSIAYIEIMGGSDGEYYRISAQVWIPEYIWLEQIILMRVIDQ